MTNTPNSVHIGIKLIAILFFIIAGITILYGIFSLLLASIVSIGDSVNSGKEACSIFISVIISLLMGALFLISGIGLLNRKLWSKTLAIILSVLLLAVCLFLLVVYIGYHYEVGVKISFLFLFIQLLIIFIFAFMLGCLLFNKKIKEYFSRNKK